MVTKDKDTIDAALFKIFAKDQRIESVMQKRNDAIDSSAIERLLILTDK